MIKLIGACFALKGFCSSIEKLMLSWNFSKKVFKMHFISNFPIIVGRLFEFQLM